MIKSNLAYKLYEAGVISYDDFSSIESRPNELVDAFFLCAVGIEAEAGRAGFIAGFLKARLVYCCEVGYCKTTLDEYANHYAATVRQGGAE